MLGSGLCILGEEPAINSKQREKMYAKSELFAGFLVALEEQKVYWQKQGVTLTPRELMTRHREIGCQKDESGMIVVTFYPEQSLPGGSVRYYVDPKELKVVKKSFGR